MNCMKKVILLFLSIVLFATNSHSQISGTTGDVTWSLDNGTLTISGNGAMEDYYKYNNDTPPWHDYRLSIEHIVILDGVTSIGNHAFRDCRDLSSVIIPNSVIRIGWLAFEGCIGLTSVPLPNSLTAIEYGIFQGCIGLTSIIIPNSVVSIEESAFRGCSSLTSILIPNSVASIGPNAFMDCIGLTSITIPPLVTSIEENLFRDCIGLTSITISGSIASIGVYAFSGCTGLTSITIPSSVTSIGTGAFLDCIELSSVSIPSSVTIIESATFHRCSGLTSISIPNSVISIGGSAFQDCSSLTSISIPNSVVSIGEQAFMGCTSLTSMSIPNLVNSIENGTFAGCQGLSSITIPNSVTNIGNYAFSGCFNLTSISIPNSVISIGQNAFGATGLTSIIIPNSVTSIGAASFWNTRLTSITIPNSVTSIEDGLFYNCTSLTSVTIPNSVTSIGSEAFRNCVDLTSLTIPNSVNNIGDGAFYNWIMLTSVTVGWAIPLPIQMSQDIFSSNVGNLGNLTLIVPSGTKSLYEAADVWKEFGTIVERDESNNNCDLSGLPTTNAFYEATADLCARTILSGTDEDGAVNVGNPLKRSHLAKIAFRGLYLLNGNSIPASIPSDYYPSIYPELNTETPQNTYYYQAAKALLYLEYGDGISPFDRNRTDFKPGDNIARADVLKVLLETFNIKPKLDNNTNPYPSDVDAQALLVNDPLKFGYIRRAHELGIIDAGSAFRPFDDCIRGEAFLMLYRIIKMVEANQITDPAPQPASYYEPSNITLRTIAMGLGLQLGNFNHYTKTSFALSGTVPLTFSHTYNSYTTDLPDEFYGIHDLGQGKLATYRPLGYGWSHEYHSFITRVEDRLILHWGGGNIHVYKSNGTDWVAESSGVYDEVSFEGTTALVKSKSQVEYRFKRQTTSGANILQLFSVKDRNGNELTLDYQAGQDGMMVVSSVSDGNRQLDFSYKSGTNLISEIKDPLNRSIKFDYTLNAALNGYLLTSFTDAEGHTTQYTYGNENNIASCRLLQKIQLPKGNYIENEYDMNRRLTKSVAGVGGVPKTQTSVSVIADYQNNKLNSTVQQDRGGVTSTNKYAFNANNSITKVEGDENLNVSVSYGNSNLPELPTSIKSNKADVSSIQYDSKGNVLKVEIKSLDNSETLVESMAYNLRNDITNHTDARGNTTTYNYDGNGNLTSVNAPEGVTTSVSYNSKGLPVEITNPEDIKTNMAYNAFGNMTEIQIPALSLTSRLVYDNASRLKEATDFMDRKTSYNYDRNDNLTSEVNALNHTTSYGYDANDNLTSITNAKNGVISMSYDNATDWLTSVQFAGAQKQYSYNADGTLKTFTKPDGTTLSSTYDALGRVKADGVNQYDYDSNHRLSSVKKDGKTLALSYDGFNRVKSVSYDDFSGNTVGYEYDKNGNVTMMKYPGGKNVSYSYDNLNRLKSVTDWNSNTISYIYRKDSKLSSVTYPNGMTIAYSYDSAGRQTEKITKRGNSSVIASYSFTLDKVGNITSENKTEPYDGIVLPNEEVNYTYNSANRIQKAGDIDFTFDSNGNTTKRGNSSYGYDKTDKLVSVEGKTIEYDGLGNIRANGNRRYMIDIMGIGNVIAETNSSGTPTAYYIYGNGLEARIMADGTTEYYVSDYRGSVVAMVDNTSAATITHKYQYDDFGNVTQKEESDLNPFRYVGKYGVMHESDQLYYMRARFYDPTIGRFLSEDPIWSTNLYPYADNNPIMGIDPKGEQMNFIASSKDFTNNPGVSDVLGYNENISSISKQTVYGSFDIIGNISKTVDKYIDKTAKKIIKITNDIKNVFMGKKEEVPHTPIIYQL